MKKVISLVLTLFCYFQFLSTTFAQGVICRAEYISGFKSEITEAKTFFKIEETRNPKFTEVFISKQQTLSDNNKLKDNILFITNYKNDGANYPVKILYDIDFLKKQELFTLDDLLYNCDYGITKKEVRYIIDKSYYESKYFKNLFGESPLKYNISIAAENGRTVSLNSLLKAENQNKEIQNFLKRNTKIGFENRSLDDVKGYYRQQYGKDLSLSDILKKLEDDYNQRVHYKYNHFRNKYVSYIRSKTYDGLLYPDSKFVRENLDAIDQSLSNVKLTDKNFEILNFLDRKDDSSTFKKVNELFPENNTNVINDQDILFIEEKIRKNDIKYIFPLGHWNNKGVLTYIDGVKREFSIDILKRIAQKYEVKVIPIGCESSFASGLSGTTIKVNSFEIIQALFESLQGKPSLGGFIQKFTKDFKKYTFVFDVKQGAKGAKKEIQMFRMKVYPEGADIFNKNIEHITIDLSDVISSILFDDDDENED